MKDLSCRRLSLLALAAAAALATACGAPNPSSSSKSTNPATAERAPATALAITTAAASTAKVAIVGEEKAVLTSPPHVPPPITRKHPTKLIVDLEVRELVSEIAGGVDYTFWTFGGTVPGSFIRARVGDVVEFNLSNAPDSKMPHNIDLHAATGPGGGAASSFTAPGHTSQFSFQVLNPGLYVYHCATAPVGMHVANGMYGLILVEPEGGLPPVDKEYYVMQGDFYTMGGYGEAGLQPFSMEKDLTETPDHVVFNGRVGSLVGDKAITAEVGEKVRLFIGNGGPNLVSSLHVIGEIFDSLHPEGGSTLNHDVQTTLVPAGGSAITDFVVEVPGTYILGDHSIFRAFNKGALGMLAVQGPESKLIYSGKQDDRIDLPEGGAIQSMPGEAAAKAPSSRTLAEHMDLGARGYTAHCLACHQANGRGMPAVFPPLAKSDYLMADKERSIKILLEGLSGPITVNGVAFNSVMPALNISDDDAANILTYVRNSWGNSGDMVTADEVRAARSSH